MEKNRGNFRNDMYRYITRGNTLYDFLAKYVDESDFSSSAMFNALRRDLNLQQNVACLRNEVQYNGFVNFYKQNIEDRLFTSMLQNMNSAEKDELLQKLQSVNPKLYSFPGILQYMSFVEDANFTQRALIANEEDESSPVLNKDIDELNRILVDTATEKADPDLIYTMRKFLMQGVYINTARKEINKEIDGPGKEEKLEKIALLHKIFSSIESAKEYDDAISHANALEDEAMLKVRTQTEYKLKRLSAIANLTGKSMSDLLLRCDSHDGSFINLLSKEEDVSRKEYEPREGDYSWSFLPQRDPAVILHEKIEFSENGGENQRAIVANYGDFNYKRNLGLSSFSDAPLELLGVTILGSDENWNFFVLTPSENVRNIRNGVNSEYYKKVLLSPFVLDDTIGKKSSFLPCMNINDDGFATLDYSKEFALVDAEPQDAVKYATRFKGTIGREHVPMTIQDFCNSQELFKKQMRILQQVEKFGSRPELPDRGEY